MHTDLFDNLNQSRRHELQVLCNHILRTPSFNHFTVRVQTRLYKNEIEYITKQYPQLMIENLQKISKHLAISCIIYKKEA